MTKEEVAELSADVPFWWHSIDLGHGIITPGEKSWEMMNEELASLQLPDLHGKSVLDIGAYDGFYSFEAERRGASRVVALDHYAWSLDLGGHIAYWRECKEQGITPLPNEQTPHWRPQELPGKVAYDTAHRTLGSRVETVVADYMEVGTAEIGAPFDVVLYLGVLYHMENPLASMKRVAAFTKETTIIGTHATYFPDYEDLEVCEFFSSNQLNGDPTNWWSPNAKAIVGMCLAAGFSEAKVVGAPEWTRPNLRTRASRALGRSRPEPVHYRAVVHARK